MKTKKSNKVARGSQVTVYFKPDTLELVDNLVKKLRMSRSTLVRLSLEKYSESIK